MNFASDLYKSAKDILNGKMVSLIDYSRIYFCDQAVYRYGYPDELQLDGYLWDDLERVIPFLRWYGKNQCVPTIFLDGLYRNKFGQWYMKFYDDDSNNELRIFLKYKFSDQKQQYVSFSNFIREGTIYENI